MFIIHKATEKKVKRHLNGIKKDKQKIPINVEKDIKNSNFSFDNLFLLSFRKVTLISLKKELRNNQI